MHDSHLRMIQLNAMAGAAQPLRAYRALALSGAGDRIVALESSDPGGLPLRPHASVVARDAASGAVLHDYDPCPGCAYNCPNWSPDGQRDVETPPAQSMEFWSGLRAMGVPSSLVIYDGEGHALRKPDKQRDVRRRTLAWFARYLAPAQP